MIRPRGFCEHEKCCVETKSGTSLEISLIVFLGMDIRLSTRDIPQQTLAAAFVLTLTLANRKRYVAGNRL